MNKLVLGAIAAALAGSAGLATAATVVTTDTPVVKKEVRVHTTPSGNTIVKKKVALKHPMHKKVVVTRGVGNPHHVVVGRPAVHKKTVHKVVHPDGSSTKVIRHDSNT